MGQGCTCEKAEWTQVDVGRFCAASHSSSSTSAKPQARRRSRERWGPQIYKEVVDAEDSDLPNDDGEQRLSVRDLRAPPEAQSQSQAVRHPRDAAASQRKPSPAAPADQGDSVAALRRAQEQRSAAANSFKDNLRKAFLDGQDEGRPPSPERSNGGSSTKHKTAAADKMASVYLEDSRQKLANNNSAAQAKVLPQQRAAMRAASKEGPNAGAAAAAAVAAAARGSNKESTDKAPHKEYMIRLDRKPGSRLGVEIASHGKTIIISNIKGDGIISRWNNDHPDQQVHRGDLITSVNGVTGPLLVEELKQEGHISVILQRRSESEGQRAPQ